MNKSDQPRKPIGAVPVLASVAAFVLLVALNAKGSRASPEAPTIT